jgi:hypothetical protein
MHAIVRKANGAYVDVSDCSVSGETAKSPRANGGVSMVCYCCCPVPYDEQYTCWLAVYSTPMTAADKPMHADDLPFPLLLPLYPDRDLLLLAFRAKRSENAAGSPPPTVYLHFPTELTALVPLRLTVALWREAAPAWQAALKALSIGSWLAYAFDGLWALSSAADDMDMYIEHECASEEEVMVKAAGVVVADASSTTSSAEEEDSEEEEEDVLDAEESSEGDFEEEDEDAEEEEEDADEEEDDEDDKEEF